MKIKNWKLGLFQDYSYSWGNGGRSSGSILRSSSSSSSSPLPPHTTPPLLLLLPLFSSTSLLLPSSSPSPPSASCSHTWRGTLHSQRMTSLGLLAALLLLLYLDGLVDGMSLLPHFCGVACLLCLSSSLKAGRLSHQEQTHWNSHACHTSSLSSWILDFLH